VYYAKFSNSYLSAVSKHGTKFLQHSSERVVLRRTKKFHMRSSEERVKVFQIIAKLLWYLISGKSHVGYLYNYDNNPIHNIVCPFNIETDVRDVWFMTIMLWRCRRRVAERREVGVRDLARPAMKRRMYGRTKVMHDKIAKERRIPRRKVLN
jgi:hypothetical protein